jgi:hypothetical protein
MKQKSQAYVRDMGRGVIYRTLGATLAQNNSKNRCQTFWNIIGIFAKYNINYFPKLPKSKKVLLLTRILLTV